MLSFFGRPNIAIVSSITHTVPPVAMQADASGEGALQSTEPPKTPKQAILKTKPLSSLVPFLLPLLHSFHPSPVYIEKETAVNSQTSSSGLHTRKQPYPSTLLPEYGNRE